ncbi:UNVERIFIED_CONTAM: hypothetical protein FKN15_047996 [Acipenser sinensis]
MIPGTLPACARGPETLRDRTSPNDLAQGPSGLPNGPWHLPSARTPATFRGVPVARKTVPGTSPAQPQGPGTKSGELAAHQKVPGAFPVHVRCPATPHVDLAAHKRVPVSSQHADGPQRLRVRSQRLDKRCLTPLMRGHGCQRHRTGSQQLAKRSLAPLQQCSRAPATPCGDLAACKSSLAPSHHAYVPEVRQTVPVTSQRAHRPKRPRAGSQRLDKWCLMPLKCGHRRQRQRSLSSPQWSHRPPRPCAGS